jgi:hypothetical protein
MKGIASTPIAARRRGRTAPRGAMAAVVGVLLGALLALPLSAWAPRSAEAIWVDLTPEQTDQALQIGGFQASMGNPTRFMEKWSVNLGPGKGAALLMTEFLAVAFAAEAASKNFQSLQPWEVQDARARASGKLVFSVTTFGDRPDYADGLRGWVIDGKREIQNTHWKNGTPEKAEGGGYVADSTFWFPMDGVDPDGKVTLVIRQNGTQKEWRFPFDLSQMR